MVKLPDRLTARDGVTRAPSSQPMERVRAWSYVAGAVLALAAGISIYRFFAPKVDITLVELGGSGQRWPLPSATAAALRWDFALIAGYGLALLFGLLLARAVLGRRDPSEWPVPDSGQPERRAELKSNLTVLVGAVAALAVLADMTENAMLLWATARTSKPRLLLDFATAAAVVKFCALLPAALIALSGVVIAVSRLVRNSDRRFTNSDPRKNLAELASQPGHLYPQPQSDGRASAASAHPQHARWTRGYAVPGMTNATLRDLRPVVGFCLSGGGVRSASVALGAVQSLRRELLTARYLVSVSGGGYTAGALQLALTSAQDRDNPPEGIVLHDPHTVLTQGTVEEDRVRRHASYIADTPARLVVALAIMARVLVLSLLALFGPAIVIGYLAGRAYQAFPLASLTKSSLLPWQHEIAYPSVRTGTLLAEAVLAGFAVFVYIVYLVLRTVGSNPHEWFRRAAIGLTIVAAVVALLAIAVPAVIYAAAWLLHNRGGPVSAVGSVGSVVLAYAAMLVSATLRKKKSTGGAGWRARAKAAAPAAVQLGLSATTFLVLAAGWLLLFGGIAAVASSPGAEWAALVLLFALFFVGGLLDATALSLHPFYRRRLAGAFAVRRVQRGASQVAEGYPYIERTSLAAYGKRSHDRQHKDDFPEVIFAAAANLTGEQRAPLNAVSYTFSGEWVGGPDIGYVRTCDLQDLVSPQLKNDLTVEAAVAISGAAFASAMGRMGRWYGTLLAVTGARLGSWMPNPGFVHALSKSAQARDWTTPHLPAVRRLPYLLREVFGIHRCHDRLLQVTDGGHYENLGLVELLRRRCTTIYCIDASGDAPPTAGTLRQAIELAHAELGVEFDGQAEAWDLVPGSATPLKPSAPLSQLNNRLSKTATLRMAFKYPDESGLPPARQRGTLIVAKALITPEMPYTVLAHGASDPLFPRDPTSDQFFDDDKYCSYTALGRELGKAAQRQAMQDAGVLLRTGDAEEGPALIVQEVEVGITVPEPRSRHPHRWSRR